MNKSIVPTIIGAIAGITLITNFFGGTGAVGYNNKLITECEKVEKKFSLLMDSVEKGDPGELMSYLTECQVQITHSADKVGQMDDYKGNKEFRLAVLDLLEFYEDFSQKELRELIQILSKPDDDFDAYDETRVNEIVKNFIAGEEEIGTELDEAQKAFAREYDFKLNKSP